MTKLQSLRTTLHDCSGSSGSSPARSGWILHIYIQPSHLPSSDSSPASEEQTAATRILALRMPASTSGPNSDYAASLPGHEWPIELLQELWRPGGIDVREDKQSLTVRIRGNGRDQSATLVPISSAQANDEARLATGRVRLPPFLLLLFSPPQPQPPVF